MRTIDSTLLTAQKTLHGKPCRTCYVGGSGNVSAYILGYDYREAADRTCLITLTLNNASGTFNNLTTNWPTLTHGATVELYRGITIAGVPYEEKLPTFWVEQIYYTYEDNQSLCILECIDFWGKLNAIEPDTEHTWAATEAQTILEHIAETHAGLTLKTGSVTSLVIDFTWRLSESAGTAVRRLTDMLPEFLYAGLTNVVNYKAIPSNEASVYTFGWNANHPCLSVEGGSRAWEYNSITVIGVGTATGTVSDATQIALVGTRSRTIYDYTLTTNAQCTQRAQRELNYYTAEAIEAAIICRPCHGLELYDVVTVNDPPWGGADVTGRVIAFRELLTNDDDWQQVISLGAAPEKVRTRATAVPKTPGDSDPKPPKPPKPADLSWYKKWINFLRQENTRVWRELAAIQREIDRLWHAIRDTVLPIDLGNSSHVTGHLHLHHLADYSRGHIIRGGSSDWASYHASTTGQILVGDGTDIVSVAVSGDAALAASGALTLATVNSNVGQFGSATQVPQLTVDAKGRITAVANVSITGTPPAAHTLLSHSDCTSAAAVRGDIVTAQGASPLFARLAISVPAANVRNVLGVDNAETEPAWKAALDATNPTTIAIGASASPGTSLVFSHRDHTHGAPSTWTATAHNLLSAIHGDTTTASAVRGDIITAQGASPLWTRLAISVPAANVRNVLGVDNAETEPAWKTALDATNPTTIAIGASASPGTSLVFSHRDHTHGAPSTWTATAHNLLSAIHGDTTTASAVRGDIVTAQGASPLWTRLAKGSQYQVLTGGATEVTWGQVALNQATAITGTLGVGNGGTGQTSWTQYAILYASATTTLSQLGLGTTTTLLHGNAAGAPTWAQVSLTADVTGTLPIANGGTNKTSWTQYAILYASATTTLAQLGLGTTTTILHGNAAGAPTWAAVSLANDVTGELALTSLGSYSRGYIVRGGSSDWAAYDANNSGYILVGDGTDIVSVAVSGDATLAANGAITLATVNTSVGTYGDATHVAQITVNGKGLITAVSSVAISAGAADPHDIAGASHSTSGRTAGQVLQATGATTFGWSTKTLTLTTNLTNQGGNGVLNWVAAGATLTIGTGGGELQLAGFKLTTTCDLSFGATAGFLYMYADGTVSGMDWAQHSIWTLADQITGNQNNYDPGEGCFFYLTSDASHNITGWAHPAAGKILFITNAGAQDIVFIHESASSTAANRFHLPGDANVTIGGDSSIALAYDSGSSRWRRLNL